MKAFVRLAGCPVGRLARRAVIRLAGWPVIRFALAAVALTALGQDFSQRGFVETRLDFYPQTASNDSGRLVGSALLRWEPAYRFSSAFRLSASFDARTDSHRQVERSLRLDWRDRDIERPAFSIRRLSAIYHRGPFTVEAGRQFIRWGKTDILNPTDRFAPKDFLSVTNTDFLGVTGARVTWEAQSNTIELVWAPRFTPSRTPLSNQRWTVLPKEAEAIPFRDLGARYPGGSQFGARWNHTGSGFEYSLSFYEGYNHLPLLDARVSFEPLRAEVQRFYAKLRMYGADAAVPLHWVTVKGESAWFTSSTAQSDEYLQYVIQLERQSGEWSLVGGYAGELITRRRFPFEFAPDRGLTRAFLARASYTIDASRSVSFEAAVRRNGAGSWMRGEYSQLFGQHWRATAGVTWIRGEETDFLGQYHRNSYFSMAVRYSF